MGFDVYQPEWKTDAIRNRVEQFCADNPGHCGNRKIMDLLLTEFRITVTPNQIAGAVHRWDIVRGPSEYRGRKSENEFASHPNYPPMLDKESWSLDRLRCSKQARSTEQEERRARRLSRRQEYERDRNVQAKAARESTPAVKDERHIAKMRKHNPLQGDAKAKSRILRASAIARSAPVIETLPPIPGTIIDSLPVPLKYSAPMPFKRVVECQFIMDDSERFRPKFCEEKSEPGKVYCTFHCEVTYVRASPNRRTLDALAGV